MTEQAIFPNHTPNGQHFGARHLSVVDIVAQYAPRELRETPNSSRSRYSMQCPLPGHNDRGVGT